MFNLLVNTFFMGRMEPLGLPWVRHLRWISAMDYAWQVRPPSPGSTRAAAGGPPHAESWARAWGRVVWRRAW